MEFEILRLLGKVGWIKCKPMDMIWEYRSYPGSDFEGVEGRLREQFVYAQTPVG